MNEISFGSIYSDAWGLMKKYGIRLSVFASVFLIPMFACGIIEKFGADMGIENTSVWSLVRMVISFLFSIGLAAACMKCCMEKPESIGFGIFFAPAGKYFSFIALGIVVGLGFVIACIPLYFILAAIMRALMALGSFGIYAFIALYFFAILFVAVRIILYVYVMLDDDYEGLFSTIVTSWEMTSGHTLLFVGISLLNTLCILAGACLCLIPAAVFGGLVMAVSYSYVKKEYEGYNEITE